MRQSLILVIQNLAARTRAAAALAQAPAHARTTARAAAAALVLLTALHAQARTSIDAVQFDSIALDSSVDCSRTFFKSARNFNGTVYVMPRVVPEAQDSEHQSFEIESDGKGHLTLALGLYFPRNEEQVKDEWDSEFNKGARCNFDVVKEALNADLSDESQRIKKIAPMPLTSIEVVIPGVEHVGRIGRSLDQSDEVDLLDYDGKSLPVEIPISEDEKDGLTRRMERVDGVPVQVRFRFQARSHEGGVTATIDWKQLAASLQVQAGTKKFLTQAELDVAIRASLKKMSETIKVDSAGTPSFNKIADQIVTKVLAQTPPATATTPDLKPDSSLIGVTAAIDAMSSQESNVIEYDQNSAPETATAETVVHYHAKPKDPNLREVRVRAGFANPTLDEPIHAGETIKITPAYHFLAKFNFKQVRRTYVTTSQIQELRLAEKFPDIASDQMVIANRKLGERLMAVGKWIPLGGFSPVYSPSRYLWLRTEIVRDMDPDFGQAFSPGLETLKKLPITVAFSNYGGRFASGLADLVGDHELWSTTYDASGTIILTAKKDLGLLTFIEHFRKNQSSIVDGEKDLLVKNVVMDSVTEEQHSITGSTTPGKPVILNADPITIVQARYVILNVSLPQVQSPSAPPKL